jgi:hypothetical protein
VLVAMPIAYRDSYSFLLVEEIGQLDFDLASAERPVCENLARHLVGLKLPCQTAQGIDDPAVGHSPTQIASALLVQLVKRLRWRGTLTIEIRKLE